jgi:hypothetical protein
MTALPPIHLRLALAAEQHGDQHDGADGRWTRPHR